MLSRAIAGLALRGMRAELVTFPRTMRRGRGPVTMYFQTRPSTAMAEGVHTVVKLIKRISFGFCNVTRYRAAIMLGPGCAFTLDVRAAWPATRSRTRRPSRRVRRANERGAAGVVCC